MSEEDREAKEEKPKDTSAIEALAAMGISVEDMVKAEEQLAGLGYRRYKTTDSRICACGHAIARHTVTNGAVYCKPARMECPCKNCRPVLEAQDIRKFMRKTTGSGPFHALTLGIMSHVKNGLSIRWLEQPKCDRCGAETNDVVPVPVTQSGSARSIATGYDALLCPTCRAEV